MVYLRDLIAVLIGREMKLRYRRSALGFAWSLLNPLAQLLIFGFVFARVLPLGINNYPSFLFCGLLVWNWFSASLYQSTDSIVGNRDLVRQPGFPSAVLPVITIAGQMIQFLLALPVLFFFLALNGIFPSIALLALPLLIFMQFIFTLSLAYLGATFHVTFRDTQYLLSIILLLGFYLTPVFYDASLIPEQYQAIYMLNPMYHLIQSYRQIFLFDQISNLLPLAVLGIVSTALLVVSYQVFSAASSRFVEEL